MGSEFDQMAHEQIQLIKDISTYIGNIISEVRAMTEERKKANKIEDVEERAAYYCHKVKPYFEKIKYASDKLELLIDDELWPLTKTRELLFVK